MCSAVKLQLAKTNNDSVLLCKHLTAAGQCAVGWYTAHRSPDKVLFSSAGAGLPAAAQANGRACFFPAALLAVAVGAVTRHVAWPLAAPAQAVGTVPRIVTILQRKGQV